LKDKKSQGHTFASVDDNIYDVPPPLAADDVVVVEV